MRNILLSAPFHYRVYYDYVYSETVRGGEIDRETERDRLRRRLGKVWKQSQTRDRKNTQVNTLLLTACLWLDAFASWKLFCWVDRARNYSLLANRTLQYGRRPWEQHTTWALRLHIIQREWDSKNIPYMWCFYKTDTGSSAHYSQHAHTENNGWLDSADRNQVHNWVPVL